MAIALSSVENGFGPHYLLIVWYVIVMDNHFRALLLRFLPGEPSPGLVASWAGCTSAQSEGGTTSP